MKILFMGTPEFAVPSLNALLSSSHTVVGAVTQPDRALKHGKTEIGAVKKAALAANIPVFQPDKIRNELERIKRFGADIAVTAAFGQILTQEILDAFPRGVINVHASVLPKYRGASPIYAAIAAGERETGVTIMRTDVGIDTGDILSVRKTDIRDGETCGELTERLAAMGAELLVKTLDGLDGITPVKQNDGEATRCRTVKKSEQYIDFSADAKTVANKIRALSPVPCAKTAINGEIYKIYSAAVADGVHAARAGEIVRCDDKLIISCADGAVEILRIQAPSKRALDISEFLRGKRFDVGVMCAKPQ
ncbi:MAG: methionyl-tRNA formyltransferase [Roseburia sp.]|nr:methionyl-tRNA formyltransferase [Roseburia sp.]